MGCKMRVDTATLAEQVESVLASATNFGHHLNGLAAELAKLKEQISVSHKSEQMLSTLHEITIEASSDAGAALVALAAEAQELQSAIDAVQHWESMLSTAQGDI